MILITGAGGFVGSHLIPRIKTELIEQVIPGYHSKNFVFYDDKIYMDLTGTEHFDLLKQHELKPDIVIHLAGQLAKPGQTISQLYRSNVLATVNLLEYCLDVGVKHFIFTSSYKIYGFPSVDNVTEEIPSNPLDHYAMSKVCCENILKLAPADDMAITVFRFPSICSEDNKTGAVYNFCKEAIMKGTITIKAEVPVPFDAININDVINSFLCAIDTRSPGYSVYNITTGEPNSLDILADRISGLVPDCTIIHSKTPQPVLRFDPAKAHRVLGWKAVPSHIRLRYMLEMMTDDR
jgi:nucleoside-diphosphate-sugar epimerase